MIILTPETKTCMSHLLAHETFDHFSFIEGEIITFGKFTMSGFLQKSFFDEPPKEEYALWKLFRDYCYSIIRGKRTPLSFRLIFSLAPEEIGRFLSDSRLDFPLSDVQGPVSYTHLAPRIAFPERVFNFPSSFKVSTEMLTDVAVSMIPINTFCSIRLAAASDSITPGLLKR